MGDKNFKRFVGFYRPMKGALTNTRIYMMGIQFKITIRNGSLIIQSLRGSYKKGIQLHPTEDPLEFYYLYKNPGASIKPKETILFLENDNQEIVGLAIDKYRLMKHSFWSSLLGVFLKYFVPIVTAVILILIYI